MTLAEHLNPFFTRRVTLQTELAPTQCVERLRADVASELMFWASVKQLRGRAGGGGFAVHRFRGAHRTLPVEARGQLQQGGAGGRGTRIEVTLGWRREDSIATAIAVVGGIVGGLLAVLSVPDAPPASTMWLFAAILLLGLGLGGLTTVGDDDWLVNRLMTLLEATDVTTTS